MAEKPYVKRYATPLATFGSRQRTTRRDILKPEVDLESGMAVAYDASDSESLSPIGLGLGPSKVGPG